MKKTDLDSLKKLLDEFGVLYEVHKNQYNITELCRCDDLVIPQDRKYILFEFDLCGKFMKWAVWGGQYGKVTERLISVICEEDW